MAEAVMRQHKRRVDRWMPKKRSFINRIRIMNMVKITTECAPGFLLSFAEMVGIPSGLHIAYGMAMAITGKDIRPTIAGSVAAIVIRLLSGLVPRWEMLISLCLVYTAPYLLIGRSNIGLIICTGISMVPTAIISCLDPTAARMLQGFGSVAISMLSAPVMTRAIRSVTGGKHISSMEERLAVGYLASMCLCGGARMLLLGFNLGVLLTAGCVLMMAITLGVGAGAVAGMLGGIVLALQGLPLSIAVSLSMGGFLAGITGSLTKRRLTCGAFAMGAYLPMLMCMGTGLGCGASVLGASIVVGIMPRDWMEWIQRFIRRFLTNEPVSGDAYAAAALKAWEKTVAALARAVPSPTTGEREHDGNWWMEHLCQGCPEYEQCGCMATGLGITKAESVWQYRNAQEEIWQDSLENLRGLGCQRLYYLMDSMSSLRREDEAVQKIIHQAKAQRDMLVTHLNAMAGAARHFAMLSSGESWWDAMAARRIRKELAQRAVPAALSYVRRVEGHAQAAFELQYISGARKQAEDLCVLVSVILDAPMQLAEVDGDRILICEQPLLTAVAGTASASISGGNCCGDTCWSGMLHDGRFLVALSDGMGHGEQAALSSRQTVELLRLCMDAGYSRQQTLTAVNGMLLLGGDDERFATADLLTIDLWKGIAGLDKLGAACSWLYQQGNLIRLSGDALPLGILEDIEQTESILRMKAGDAVILLTDGVEDAFRTMTALEQAIRNALELNSPKEAAESLLQAAYEADNEQRRDDQSVVFVYLHSNRKVICASLQSVQTEV